MSKPLDFDPAWLSLLAAPPQDDAHLAAQLGALDAIKAWGDSIPESNTDDNDAE